MLVVLPGLALESVLLLYLLAVVVVAVVGGVLPALLGAVVSFLLANWFLTPPFRTLAVEGTAEIIDLVVFLLVALTVSITVDVAARRRAVAERRLAEQAAHARELAEVDRLRNALLVAVGHDLRTPLAGAKAAVSTLRLAGVQLSEAEQAQLLGTVEDSVDRLGALVSDLLDLSRVQAGALGVQLRPVALDEVVAGALLEHPAGTVHNQVPDDLPRVLVDPGLLARVVANLVENAVRYAGPGSGVVVRADPGSRSPGDGRQVRLQVVDQGPGVPRERWGRMFVPFQRLTDSTSDVGLGLGLAIAAGFTEAMGGSLEPSNTPGGGLTMTLTLPVAGERT